MVRAVLRDLVESSVVFTSGRGDATTYRAAAPDDYPFADAAGERDALLNLIWVALSRFAPCSVEALARAIPLEEDRTRDALEELVRDGRARRLDREPPEYDTAGCVIPLESEAGYEAALFDHFQAMVTAICTKLQLGTAHASKEDWVGGSTYGFEVWPGHPHRDEALAFLRSVREKAVTLREKIAAYNLQHDLEGPAERVVFYAGQSVLGGDSEGEET